VKLPVHPARTGLPGIELLFHIVPLDLAYPAIGGTGHLPVKNGKLTKLITSLRALSASTYSLESEPNIIDLTFD
jgi:hypothetical protein